MNKAEFIDAVASKGDISKSDAETAVNAVLDSLTEAMSKGDQVTLVGFGTFLVRPRKARQGRNPQSGAPIDIPASTCHAGGRGFESRPLRQQLNRKGA